jgi:Xaa-Pro aminopeptidase
MKTDLDRLMKARELDALLILPAENEDPYRAYLSNGAHFSGMVIKKQGEPPVLIANGMELDEAARSGLKVYSYDDFGYTTLQRDHGFNTDEWRRAWYRCIFEGLGVSGKVSIYGVADVNFAYRSIQNLSQELGDLIEIIPDQVRSNVFDQAYETKDADELAKLREVARQTSAVMRTAREWIAGHRAADSAVIQADGTPLTIGDVKRFVRGQLFERGLEDPEGMIFAQGRDAGMPHSKGENDHPLQLGQTIVFDLFPRMPGGYFHDMTRTWCIGYAPAEVQAVFDTVYEAYRRSLDACKPGIPTDTVQRLACEYFEELGHPTVLNTPGTAEGYVHTLAHGLGLNIHEAPYFPTFSEKYYLQPGNVFTIEPGLYYPERGYGIRIEDTVHLNAAGELEILTDCPYDLVIDLQEQV